MRIIRKSPLDIIPNITERDLTNNIVIIVQLILPNVYISICEKVHDYCCRTLVGEAKGHTSWTSSIEPTLIELLIKEYKLFGAICSEIIVLESHQDVEDFILKYSISNNMIIEKLLSKYDIKRKRIFYQHDRSFLESNLMANRPTRH